MKYIPSRITPEDKAFLTGIGIGLLMGIAIILVLAFWNVAV
jgi:hypothetical protein